MKNGKPGTSMIRGKRGQPDLSDFSVQSSAHATTTSMSVAGGALPYYPARS